MEIYNKFNINNSPKNDKEYNQKYYDYNKKSSINNNGNIHEEKLNNKKIVFKEIHLIIVLLKIQY